MEWFHKLNTPARKTYDKNRRDVSERLRICWALLAQSVSLSASFAGPFPQAANCTRFSPSRFSPTWRTAGEDIMAKYLLVSFKTCPWVQRAAIVLREKNVAFEFRHIEPDNRPDWFLAISPHKKVPVLRIDEKVSLFESNAIAEYLDETIAPRLHPEDPVQRAINRAWTDYLPTFTSSVTGVAYAADEAAYKAAAEKNRAGLHAARAGAGEAEPGRTVLQRPQIFAGGCGLRAVPAAPLFPRPNQAARRDRKISAAEGLGRGADEAAVDPLIPGERIRSALPDQRETAESLGLAVHRRRGGGGGVACFDQEHPRLLPRSALSRGSAAPAAYPA
jgi:glutathione S-transferase